MSWEPVKWMKIQAYVEIIGIAMKVTHVNGTLSASPYTGYGHSCADPDSTLALGENQQNAKVYLFGEVILPVRKKYLCAIHDLCVFLEIQLIESWYAEVHDWEDPECHKPNIERDPSCDASHIVKCCVQIPCASPPYDQNFDYCTDDPVNCGGNKLDRFGPYFPLRTRLRILIRTKACSNVGTWCCKRYGTWPYIPNLPYWPSISLYQIQFQEITRRLNYVFRHPGFYILLLV